MRGVPLTARTEICVLGLPRNRACSVTLKHQWAAVDIVGEQALATCQCLWGRPNNLKRPL